MRIKGWKNAFGRAWGFSLPEVMAAVFVLSTIAIAYYGGLASGFNVTQSAREDLRATQILLQKMEGLRLCTWSQVTNYTFREYYDPLATNQSRGTFYTGVISVGAATNVPTSVSYYSNIRTVTASIFWTNYNGRIPLIQSRQMQTQVARYGMQNYIWGRIR